MNIEKYSSPECREIIIESSSIMELSVTQGNHFGDEEDW